MSDDVLDDVIARQTYPPLGISGASIQQGGSDQRVVTDRPDNDSGQPAISFLTATPSACKPPHRWPRLLDAAGRPWAQHGHPSLILAVLIAQRCRQVAFLQPQGDEDVGRGRCCE